ncbi:hypothetical protein ABZV34_33705 [Streptomyces sp. NPDC005195]|uniref:MmyB family transcriptional regulator n=1 Tax=Streptomyces sp. NPDC005195 TaxID=3154561 RepID=UPI0033BBDC7E
MWDRHEVAKRFEDHKTLVHPALGRIEVDCQVLFTDNRAQTLLVMTTRPGTESELPQSSSRASRSGRPASTTVTSFAVSKRTAPAPRAPILSRPAARRTSYERSQNRTAPRC